MDRPHPLLFSLQQMIVDLSLIDRNHYLAGTKRRENDIEHSMTVAVLAWFVHDTYSIDLDIAKILKYALTHDFVERYAGDTNTFATSDERALKVEREKLSLDRLSDEFHQFPDMVSTMQGYELRNDEEALFVWTIDKMQALIMGDLDGWRPYQELGITYEEFCAKYSELLDKTSKYTKEIYEGLIEYCKTTYWDKP